MKNALFSLFAEFYVKVFARSQFGGANRALFYLAARGMGIHNWKSTKVSGEDYLIKRLLPQIITSSEPTLLDVGANVGDYSLALRAQFPNASIHAFEPHPATFSRLEKKGHGQHIRCYNMALGAEPSTATLFDRSDTTGSCFASLNRSVIDEQLNVPVSEFKVRVETLDEFAKVNEIEVIDYLKIDTEGWELSVLEGAKNLLRENRIKYIQFEFNYTNLQTRVFFKDFRTRLPNYRFFRLLPSGLFPLGTDPLLTELFAFQNVFAIPQNSKIDV